MITLDELEKILYIFLNNIDYNIIAQDKKRFEKISNLIQKINGYGIKNKYDLIEQTHNDQISKSNMIDKGIIVKLINQSLKD